MNVDFRETLWYRVQVDTTTIDKDKLIKALKDGVITNSIELLDYLLEETGDPAVGDYIEGNTGDAGEVELTPEQLNGRSTIECYDEQGRLIYHNGKSGE